MTNNNNEIIRVMRVITYTGPRDEVEHAVRQAVHGSKKIHRRSRIDAVTVGVFPDVMNPDAVLEKVPSTFPGVQETDQNSVLDNLIGETLRRYGGRDADCPANRKDFHWHLSRHHYDTLMQMYPALTEQVLCTLRDIAKLHPSPKKQEKDYENPDTE
jgi:hypothetical protein